MSDEFESDEFGFESDEFGFEMAFCAECGSNLTQRGYCKNRRCPFANYYQDEFVPRSEIRERRQVAGNSRSKLCYPWGSRGYNRTLKSPYAVLFRSEDEAESAGYELREE